MKRKQNPFKKGIRNQSRSKEYIIKHPEVYGILDKTRVCVVRAGIGSRDFFSVRYGERKVLRTQKTAKIDPEGNSSKKVRIQTGFIVEELNAGFDIIATPYPTTMFPNQTVWIQVKSNNFLSYVDVRYMEALKQIQVPDYVRKELHIWYDNQKEPIIVTI